MEDLKQIQEFFSKPLEENTTDWPKEVSSRYGDIIFRLVKVMSDRAKYELIDAETGKTWEVGGRVYGTVNQLKASAEDTIKPQGGRQSSQFESVNEAEGEDQIDTITMDVPLFIRVLEYAREDAQADMDLHDLAEKAIAGTKQQGLLQMDDYDMLVGEQESVDEETLTEAYVPQNIKEFAKRKGVSRLVNTVAGWAEKVGARITGGTAIGKYYDTLILDMGYQTSDIRINCDDETVELYYEPVNSFADFKRVFMEEESRKQAEHDEETLRREQGLEEVVSKVVARIKEDRPGLWANIHAQRERGEKPARKGSKDYKAAVKAGKEINKKK